MSPKERRQIQQGYAEAKATLERVRQLAARGERVAFEDCPLKPDHYEASGLIFGQGQYAWMCGFCGRHDEA